MPRFSFLVVVVVSLLLLVCLEATPIDKPLFGDFGVGFRTPKNFFRNTSLPVTGNVDVASALQNYGNGWCASGGGLREFGTGPYCSCSLCACNGQSDGTYTWCGYPYQCVGYTWGLFNLSYGDYTFQPGQPFVISEVFNNSLDVPQQFTFSKQESYTNTYSWTFSTTLSDSMTVSISASLPEICSVSDSFTTSISMTDSNTQTQTHADTWSVSQTFNVPANTAVRATMTITTAQYTMPYTAQIEFNGYGYTWCNNQVQGHWCWFTPPSYFLNFGGCYSSDGGNAICPFAGTFTGLQGVQAVVTIGPID